MSRDLRALVAAVALAATVTAGAYGGLGVAAAGGHGGSGGLAAAGAAGPALGPDPVTVRLGIEHSLFRGEELRVVEGTEVTFVVDNGDPIGHELIVGPPDVHARHATGHEAAHAPVPGEVSVGPNGEAATTYRFGRPGTVEYACHLPGHYEYGMHGTVEVVPAP